MGKMIEIKGARENKLKKIDVAIPRDALTVITVVSGSGKSSLAYDVIFAEGQRRLLDSLSSYSQHYIPQPRKAAVNSVEWLSPVVAIMQQRTAYNPRSTVGTNTDIYDYLRLLFCVVGEGNCSYCDATFPTKSVDQIIDRVQTLPTDTNLEIRTPVTKIHGEDYNYLFTELRNAGFRQVVIDEKRYDTGSEVPLDENLEYAIEVVLDHLTVREDIREQMETTLQTAMLFGGGFLRFENASPGMDESQIRDFYQGFTCTEHHIGLQALEPYYFSFNDPGSFCRTCRG